MARGQKRGTARRWVVAVVAVLALVGAGVWEAGAWRPSRSHFPVQGVLVEDTAGPQQWPLIKGMGANFAYIVASRGAGGMNPDFADGLAAARAAGLTVGAVHVFDPCRTATEQSRNFVVMVPRDKALLPPAVRLTTEGASCADLPNDGAVQAELMTFINQIEAHIGKPVILMIDRAFEKRYRLAGTLDRNLWVSGDYLAPGYTGRPWVLWTANRHLRNPAGAGSIEWVVVQP